MYHKGTYRRTFIRFLGRIARNHTGPRQRTAFWDHERGQIVSGYKSTAYTKEGLALRRLTRLKHITCNGGR